MLCPLKSCKTNGCNCFREHGLFLGFIALSLIIWIFKLNVPLFYFINSLHVVLPPALWLGINFIANYRTFILPILLLLITYIWFTSKLKRVVILLIAYYLVFGGLKILCGELRPYMILPQNSFFWLSGFEDALKSAHNSFPSGHVGNMAIFVFTLSKIVNQRWLKILLFLLLLLTALARICTGWHWPLDVMASGLIGYFLVNLIL